jgi:hypothetical protein
VKIFFLSIFSLFLLASCNHSSDVEQGSGQSEALSLNEGKKWPVNAEMKPHIEKAHEILKEYQARQDEDFKTLAEALDAQNTSLIKSCTMTGEGHEELHKWLYPHMELIDKLSDAKDKSSADQIISELENSFNTYHEFFK